MGKAVQRKGDKNDKGGAITQGVSSVLVDGKQISVKGNPVAPHSPNQGPHVSAKTQNTQNTVFADGKPVVIAGDTDTCGDKRVGGSAGVSIG